MKQIKVLTASLMLATIAGLSFSSCKRDCSNSMPDPDAKATTTFKVTGDSYLLRADGTMVPFSVSNLRAAENDKGRITGLGEFAPQTRITVKAERKGSYRLYKFYSDRGGVIPDNDLALVNKTATEGNITKVKDVSSEVTFKVTSDVHFKAIFSEISNAGITYEDLNVGGHNGNFSDTYNAKGETKTYRITGNKKTPIVSSGTTVGHDVETYQDWEVSDNQSWITASNAPKGTLTVIAAPHKSKTEGRRSGVVTVSKGNQTIQLTVNQDSYYDDAPTDGSEYPVLPGSADESNGGSNDNTSKVIAVNSTVTYTVNPKGISNVSPATIYSLLGRKLHVSTPIYRNGSIVGYKDPADITFDYGTVNGSWLTYSGGKYRAPRNVSGSTRTATQVVKLMAKGKVIRTITITFNQATDKFNVSGDIE